jgi:hypothetical protein
MLIVWVVRLINQSPNQLFDLFMNSYFLEVWVEFLQLQTLRIVLFVLSGDVTAGTRHAGCLLLSAFQNYLYTVSFLCHFYLVYSVDSVDFVD